MTWGGANEDRIVIFNWTSALTHSLWLYNSDSLWRAPEKDDNYQLSLSGKDGKEGKDKHSFYFPPVQNAAPAMPLIITANLRDWTLAVKNWPYECVGGYICVRRQQTILSK